MSSLPRHRVVHSESLPLLQLQVADLLKTGWRLLGEPAMATPADRQQRPYWVQTLYKHSEAIPLEQEPVKPLAPPSDGWSITAPWLKPRAVPS